MTDLPADHGGTFPPPRTCPLTQPEEYARWRRETPILRVEPPAGGRPWLLTRYADVRQALTDPALGSNRGDPGFPRVTPPGVQDATGGPQRRMLLSMDPPEHTEARRQVQGEFTVKRMRALEPRIRQITDECIDGMLAAGPPADLVSALALPVPSAVICELLGVPYADHGFFQRCARLIIASEVDVHERAGAMRDLTAYLDRLVSGREQAPADDLLSRQILEQRAAGEVDHHGLVLLALLLLVAGHETTANMIALGTVALLTNPEQLARIGEDPSATPAAVEELLRYCSITDAITSRVALADTQIGGVPVAAGEGVIAMVSAANHDPAAFPDPGRFDVTRDARHHVAFGYGRHQCLGQHLARLELQVVFDTLCARIPGLHLVDALEDLPIRRHSLVHGLDALPVAW